MTNFKFYFEEDILFIEFKSDCSKSCIDEIVQDLVNSFPDKSFKIVAFKNPLGYWAAYLIDSRKSIYCGTQSLKTTKEQIKKYKDEN